MLDKGYIPVISTVGCDEQGNAYNINGDTAAAFIAGALGAERLIMMTDIAGISERPARPLNSNPQAHRGRRPRGSMPAGVISGGMIPKVDCCIEALNRGVESVIIMDGRVPHSILMEILTDEGAGTMVIGDGIKMTDIKAIDKQLCCKHLRPLSCGACQRQRLPGL